MSSTLNLTFRVDREDVSDRLGNISRFLQNPARAHYAIRPGMEKISREYLAGLALVKHTTALRLGGAPTGELARAATKVASYADASSARVQFGSPLLARAFRDLTIKPGAGKKYLTIPVSGAAYGLKIASFQRKYGKLRFLGRPGGAARVAALFERGRKVGTAHYLLVKEVHQKQDRTLLPSDDAYWERAAEDLTARILREWRDQR